MDVAYGGVEKRKILAQGAEFVVTNCGGVSIVADGIAAGGFDLIIVDEARTTRTRRLIDGRR